MCQGFQEAKPQETNAKTILQSRKKDILPNRMALTMWYKTTTFALIMGIRHFT